MDLQRGLRDEDDARAAADVDRLRECITAKDTGSGADENHVRGAAQVEGARDAKRRLCVLVSDDGAAASLLERELEPGVAAD